MPKVKQFDEIIVLKKAKEVFCEKGYNGTSMDDLVQATGLSRSSIYDTFGDKHSLFLKVLNHYRCDSQSTIQQMLAKTDSPKKKISIVFENIICEILEDKDQKGCLLINASMELNCVDKEVSGMAIANMAEMENSFYNWLKEGQATGEINSKFPPEVLAKHLFNSLMGLRITGRHRPDPTVLRDNVNVTLSVLNH